MIRTLLVFTLVLGSAAYTAVADGSGEITELAQHAQASPDVSPNLDAGLALDDDEPLGNAEAEEINGGPSFRVTPRFRMDTRGMSGTEIKTKPELMAAEAELLISAGSRLDAAVQVPLATSMKGRGKDMHFGNAYAVIKGNIGQPSYKLGQFVIPFGNLADYETHTRILQTLYPYSLGIRIDRGLQIDGFLGRDTEFALSATTGNGPGRGRNDGSYAFVARAARRMMVGDDDVKIGFSTLRGRLPVFSVMSDPLMDGREAMLQDVTTGMTVPQSDPMGFADKTRYAVDVEYYRGIDLVRAEAVIGTDNGKSVGGYWLQIEHPFNYKTSLAGLFGRWNQAHGNWRNIGVGLEHKLQDARILRLALERRRASDMGMSMNMNMATLQYLTEF